MLGQQLRLAAALPLLPEDLIREEPDRSHIKTLDSSHTQRADRRTR
jgi:hypothetical protein